MTIFHKNGREQAKLYFDPSEPLEYPEVDKSGNPKNQIRKTWKQRVNLTYQNKTVKGFFIIMKTGSYSQPGVRLFRNRRVIQGTIIEPNSPQILLGTKNKYASQRLYGEIHLNEFEIDFMKTKFSGDLSPLYLELKQKLQEKRFIDQVNYYRSTRDTKEEKETRQSETKSIPDEKRGETCYKKKRNREDCSNQEQKIFKQHNKNQEIRRNSIQTVSIKQ